MRADSSERPVARSDHRATRLAICASVAGIVLLAAMLAVAMAAKGPGQDPAGSSVYPAKENYSYAVGLQAYVYGLAPVIMAQTERQMVSTPGMGHAPVNQFGFASHLATPDDTLIVTPNADTLYHSAWLELGREPIVLHVPDTGGRYYVEELLDAYTNNFADVGRRATGTDAGDFAIAGPGWNGSLPAGIREIRSPTDTAWIIGRILVNGASDLPDVTALERQFTLTPLSRYGQPAGAMPNETLADLGKLEPSPQAQDRLRFFEELRVALKNNPPPAGEEALMAVFGQVGLLDNSTPYGDGMDPAMAAGLARAATDGRQIVTLAFASPKGAKNINGWTYMTKIGTYGYDYLTRAAVAQGGLGANVPEEAVYPKAQADHDGQPLTGARNYTIHFAGGNLPPVDAFWSLTIYNATTYMLVPNALGRYAIGDRTPGLQYGPGGSLDIYIGRAPPAGRESNWLPAPDGDFYLILRMYQPRPEVLNGSYDIPPVMDAAGTTSTIRASGT